MAFITDAFKDFWGTVLPPTGGASRGREATGDERDLGGIQGWNQAKEPLKAPIIPHILRNSHLLTLKGAPGKTPWGLRWEQTPFGKTLTVILI